jgi:hypothetical protein
MNEIKLQPGEKELFSKAIVSQLLRGLQSSLHHRRFLACSFKKSLSYLYTVVTHCLIHEASFQHAA